MIKTKESHSKVFIERDASNTWCQEVGMGQCHCWGSATPTLSKAEELWDQESQIPSWHTGAAQPLLTALTQIYPHPVMLISPLTSGGAPDCPGKWEVTYSWCVSAAEEQGLMLEHQAILHHLFQQKSSS